MATEARGREPQQRQQQQRDCCCADFRMNCWCGFFGLAAIVLHAKNTYGQTQDAHWDVLWCNFIRLEKN
jgi:hypothetical protein